MSGAKSILKELINRAVPDRYFVTRLSGDDSGVVVTFDDGPHPEWTPRSLDILDELDIKATYFLIGQEAERHVDIVREIVARGHTVGDHTYSHCSIAGLAIKRLSAEVVDNRKRLSDLSGQDVRLFRPPWGRIDVRSAAYLIGKGLRIVMWSIDSTDYKKAGADDIMARVASVGVREGDIVLMHDDNEHTLHALPRLAETVREKGLAFGNLYNH